MDNSQEMTVIKASKMDDSQAINKYISKYVHNGCNPQRILSRIVKDGRLPIDINILATTGCFGLRFNDDKVMTAVLSQDKCFASSLLLYTMMQFMNKPASPGSSISNGYLFYTEINAVMQHRTQNVNRHSMFRVLITYLKQQNRDQFGSIEELAKVVIDNYVMVEDRVLNVINRFRDIFSFCFGMRCDLELWASIIMKYSLYLKTLIFGDLIMRFVLDSALAKK